MHIKRKRLLSTRPAHPSLSLLHTVGDFVKRVYSKWISRIYNSQNFLIFHEWEIHQYSTAHSVIDETVGIHRML